MPWQDTNAVVCIQANALDEVEQFVGISSALLVNMGTLSSDWIAAKKLAAKKVGTGCC